MGKHSADSGSADTAQVRPSDVAERLAEPSGQATTVFPRVTPDTGRIPAEAHEVRPSRSAANDDTTVIAAVDPAKTRRQPDGLREDDAASEAEEQNDTDLESDTERKHDRSIGRWVSVVVFWLAAMLVGFVAALVCVARYGCSGAKTGFACGHGGLTVGIALLVVVVLTVGVATVLCLDSDRRARYWLRPLAAGVVVLAVVLVIARVVLGTAT